MTEILCPSGFTFRPRKFTGRILAQIAARDMRDSIVDVVDACCVEVVEPGPYALGQKDGRPNWKQLLESDSTVAFARLKVLSIPAPKGHDPEEYDLHVTCDDPDCIDPDTGRRTTFVWTVRLCDVPVIPLPPESREIVRKGNAFRDTLPDERGFTFKLPTAEDWGVIRRLLAENRINPAKLDQGNAATVLMPFIVAARVLSIEGLTSTDAARSEILDLDPGSIGQVAERMTGRDGGFDEFKALCERCGGETLVRLPPSPRLLERPKKWASAPGPSSSSTSPG